jgi:hypothetical protein
MQTGELDGIAWSGITEVYTVGWADVTKYFLTNNISGAWIGHFFANMERWNALPPNLQELLATCFEQLHYYRQHWYWAGEADLRVNGGKLELTTIPDAEWQTVRGRRGEVLGRDRCRKRGEGQGRGDHQAVQRDHGEGGQSLPLRLTPMRPDAGWAQLPILRNRAPCRPANAQRKRQRMTIPFPAGDCWPRKPEFGGAAATG